MRNAMRIPGFLLMLLIVQPPAAEAWEDDVDEMFDIFRMPKQPAISLVYGIPHYSLADYPRDFGDAGMFELRIGGVVRSMASERAGIIDHSYRYLTIANLSTDHGSGTAANEVAANNWRVGFAIESGYGYALSSSADGASIIPYYSSGLSWTHVDLEYAPMGQENGDRLDRFDESIRFGSMTEAGIRIQLADLVSVDFAYERSIILERHLFWKWAGGVIIEGVAQSLVDRFVDTILESSPAAAPIVRFALKNGLAYGVYELRKENMNWPFDTAAPLFSEGFKMGLSFTF
jgi:hypothetical protein